MNRGVGRFMGNVEAEWAVLVFLNEFEGVAIDQVSGVAIFNGFFSTVPPIVLVVISPVIDVVDVAAVVAAEIVESMILRVKFGIALLGSLCAICRLFQ